MSFVFTVMKDAMRPQVNDSAADWLRINFYSHTGEAFSEQQCPWVTAPQGPCWAYDSIQFRTLWLQWAARMFKTNFGLAMLQRSMDQRPEETMFATPDETNCKQVFSRLWKMIEHCPRLRDQAPLPIRQSKTQIKLKRSNCHGAWPRGKSRLADKSIRVAHGNEIDKWVQESTSTEGDPIARFRKRGAEYPDRKFVMESTPSVRGKSSIETGRQESTDHRYHVPCPHCFKFQMLEFGDGSGPGQIHYDRPPHGRTDKDLARKTAHYVCLHCEERIEDIHRPWMMNRGVWVPAGCKVDHEKAMEARDLPPDDMSWLIGEPSRWGADYGCQLSVFYALFHGWGDIVCDFLEKCKKPKMLQQWINEDKGETWEIKKTLSTPERLAKRLHVRVPRGALPEWTELVTVTIDQQEADGGYRVWTVLAHGAEQQAHLVDVGTANTLEDVWNNQIRTSYPHLDGGNPMMPHAASADSGWDTKATYDFCNTHEGMVPCKGSSTDLGGRPYKLDEVEKGEYAGQMLFTVNTDFWETDLQARLDERLPGDVGALSLFDGAENDLEFLEHMCNATLADRVDSRGNAKLLWVKKDESAGNDFRDCVKYGIALAHAFIDENEGFPPRSGVATETQSVVNHGENRPDGRSWHGT